MAKIRYIQFPFNRQKCMYIYEINTIFSWQKQIYFYFDYILIINYYIILNYSPNIQYSLVSFTDYTIKYK